MNVARRGWSIDSLALIFSIIVVAQLLVFIVPQGSYEREPYPQNPDRSMVVPGTYAQTPEAAEVDIPAWYFLAAIPKGMQSAQDIIFLVFIAGGVIAIFRRTGAIDAMLHRAVAALGGSPWILIAGCLLLFAFGAYTIGMGEEYVPLIPIVVSMCLAMRMDAVVAMGLVWIPYGVGWACSGVNPFGVVIAQNIAGLPITSGWAFRLFMMLVFLAIGFHHLYRYAMKVKRDPSASLVSHIDYSSGFEQPDDVRLTGRRIGVLMAFLLTVVGFVVGAANYGWYIGELNTIFLGFGIVAALIAGLSPGETSRAFIRGASEMTAAALLIGFARSIEVVLSDGQIIDTVIHSIAQAIEGLGPEASAVGMLVVQSLCNFFIPSGSGQAFVTMPIMSPLATLTGVPQQTAVIAFQFGDGLTNMIVPTSALVMGALALGKIPYGAWVRFIAPLLLKIYAVGVVFLILSVHFGDALGLNP
ncbi:MAG: TIGR00366 family protein [Woeseiaceae bacterium]|nr:TIGR00366 family protein [Woeseiaceae bacterium]